MESSNKKNIVLQTIYQISALIIPFITAPYISRVLGAEQTGVYSYTYSIVNYFMMFVMLGIDYYGNRSIAATRNDKNKLNKVFSEIFFAHVIIGTIVLCIYITFCFIFGGIYRYLFLIQTICIIGELININWLFAGLGEFKITVVRNIIIKIITVIAIFIFVKKQEDLWCYILILSLGTAISTSAVWIVLPKYVKIISVNIKSILLHIKPLFILYIAIMASHLMQVIDKTMLGNMVNMSSLGCYEYADKIMKIPLAFIGAVGTVMLSSVSKLYSCGEKDKAVNSIYSTVKYIFVFCSLFVFGFISYGEEFSVIFLGDEFELTGKLVTIFSIGLIFSAVNDVLRTQYFIPNKKDKYYVIAISVGAIVNIILNVFLIDLYGAYGATIATVISYGVITIIELVYVRKEIRIFKLLGNNAVPLILGIIPFILSFLWKSIIPLDVLGLIINIFIFLVEFGIVLVVYLVSTKQLKEFIGVFSKK